MPPGWPAEVLPPEVEDGQQSAVAWLLDRAPADWRQDPVLRAQPVLLARRVVEHVCADVAAARAAWVPPEQRVRAGLPEDTHAAVRKMHARQGPTMTAAAIAGPSPAAPASALTGAASHRGAASQRSARAHLLGVAPAADLKVPTWTS